MHEPTYRQAISHSWRLAWDHKLLLIFGFFATLLGQMGVVEILGKISFPSLTTTLEGGHILRTFVAGFSGLSLSIAGWAWFGWLIAIILSLAAILLVVSVISQGALIHASAQWAKKDSLPSTDKSWHSGATHFWGLLLVNILRKSIVVILGACVGCAVVHSVFQPSTALGMVYLLVVFVIAALVGMLISFLAIYTASYMVVENYPFSWALSAAWRLFVKHWLVSFEVGFIILGLNILLSLFAVLGLIILFIPTFLTWFITFLAGNSILWILGSVVTPFLFALFVVFLGSWFTVFSTSVWTYLFMKMHKVGIISRIVHILK